MLREPTKYLSSRISTDKPLWHWGELFKDVIPGGSRGSDLDRVITYRGHFLFVEAKTSVIPMTVTQERLLTELAGQPKHHVVVVYLRQSVNDDFTHSWTPSGWVWAGRHNWIAPRYRIVGGTEEFREVMKMWRQQVDEMAAANDAYWASYRKLRHLRMAQWVAQPGLI